MCSRSSVMRLPVIAAVCLLLFIGGPARADSTVYDDFVSSSARVHDLKLMCILITSQVDEKVGRDNTAQLRTSFWPASPQARLSPQETELEMKELDRQWASVVAVVKERHITSISFAGLDMVLTKKAQDWYFAAPTPRGPVLIRMSIQFNAKGPMTVHGMRVWTKWDEVKAVSHAMQFPAGEKIMTFNYVESAAKSPATQPDEQP